jgi:acyl carrier protein
MLKKISKIIEDISGTSISESSFNKSFLDLGLDSLVLTQIAKVISKETKSQINLRHLMENYPSVEFLTNYLLDTLSNEIVDSLMPEQISTTTVEERNSNSTEPVKLPISSSNEKSLENVIIRQMDIIERLITLLEKRERNNQIESNPVVTPVIKKSAISIEDSVKTNDTIMQLNNPPVPGARLGRDENGNPAWYIPDPSHNGNFIKLGN